MTHMPIISAEVIQKQTYRLCISTCKEITNIVVTPDGVYNISYVKEGRTLTKTGKILNVVSNKTRPQNSYILFDWSDDASSKRERIYFFQVTVILDVTPNDAYRIALQHGFEGTVEDWLESLRGEDGKDAYAIALEQGFVGTEAEWLATLRGDDGKSAYDVAVEQGFTGTVDEWLESIRGKQGKTAYDIAVENGFTGSEADWLETLRGPAGLSAYELAVVQGFEGTIDEWYAKNGDTVVINQTVDILTDRMKWVEGMVSSATNA